MKYEKKVFEQFQPQLKMLFLIISSFLFPGLSYAQEMRTVTKVIYGDTIELDGKETVRLIGIWAPKTESERKPNSVVAAWERRARDFTEGWVLNRPVWLEYEGKEHTNEKGETLAYVFFRTSGIDGGGGGQKVAALGGVYMLNRLLVGYGFAHTQWKSSFRFRTEFKELEREAAIHRKGLWQDNF